MAREALDVFQEVGINEGEDARSYIKPVGVKGV